MNRCIKIRTHKKFQIKIIPGTSWDVVFLRLSLFGFVLLYIFLLYLIWYVDILFCIMFGLFLRTRVTKNTINYNYRYYYRLQKTPTVPETAVLLLIRPFLLSLPSISYVSTFHLFSTFINPIIWCNRYSHQPMSRYNFFIRSPDNDILQFSETIHFSESR